MNKNKQNKQNLRNIPLKGHKDKNQQAVYKETLQNSKSENKKNINTSQANKQNFNQNKHTIENVKISQIHQRVNTELKDKNYSVNTQIDKKYTKQDINKSINQKTYISNTQHSQKPTLKQNQQQKMMKLSTQIKNDKQTLTQSQAINCVKFNKTQRAKLYFYFKALCQHNSIPQNLTFQEAKNMYTSISITQWMHFCRNMKILQKIKTSKKDAMKWLTFIYKKHQNQQKRINFDMFRELVKALINQIAIIQSTHLQDTKTAKSEEITKQTKIKQIIDQLGLSNQSKFKERLKQFGVFNLQTQSRSHRKTERANHKTKEQKEAQKQQRFSLNKLQSKAQNLTKQKQTQKKQKQNTSLPKIYRTNLQRKQSKLMHSLAITNIHKLAPPEQTKQLLNECIGKQDKYLKQYFNKRNSYHSQVNYRSNGSTLLKTKKNSKFY